MIVGAGHMIVAVFEAARHLKVSGTNFLLI